LPGPFPPGRRHPARKGGGKLRPQGGEAAADKATNPGNANTPIYRPHRCCRPYPREKRACSGGSTYIRLPNSWCRGPACLAPFRRIAVDVRGGGVGGQLAWPLSAGSSPPCREGRRQAPPPRRRSHDRQGHEPRKCKHANLQTPQVLQTVSSRKTCMFWRKHLQRDCYSPCHGRKSRLGRARTFCRCRSSSSVPMCRCRQ